MDEYDNVDELLPRVIEELRAEHHACTARAVARELNMSPDVIRYRLVALRDAGVVTWSEEMAGSLRVLTPVTEAEEGESEEEAEGESVEAGPAEPEHEPPAGESEIADQELGPVESGDTNDEPEPTPPPATAEPSARRQRR